MFEHLMKSVRKTLPSNHCLQRSAVSCPSQTRLVPPLRRASLVWVETIVGSRWFLDESDESSVSSESVADDATTVKLVAEDQVGPAAVVFLFSLGS